MVVVMVTVMPKHPVVNQLMVRVQSVQHPLETNIWVRKSTNEHTQINEPEKGSF